MRYESALMTKSKFTSKSQFRFHIQKCTVQQKLQEMEELTSECDAYLCMLVQLNKELESQAEINMLSKKKKNNTRGAFSLA